MIKNISDFIKTNKTEIILALLIAFIIFVADRIYKWGWRLSPRIVKQIKPFFENRKEIRKAKLKKPLRFGVRWDKGLASNYNGIYAPHELTCRPSPEACNNIKHYLYTAEIKPIPFCPKDPRKSLNLGCGSNISSVFLECSLCGFHFLEDKNKIRISFKDAATIMSKELGITKK